MVAEIPPSNDVNNFSGVSCSVIAKGTEITEIGA
jgi:hypothetical protein